MNENTFYALAAGLWGAATYITIDQWLRSRKLKAETRLLQGKYQREFQTPDEVRRFDLLDQVIRERGALLDAISDQAVIRFTKDLALTGEYEAYAARSVWSFVEVLRKAMGEARSEASRWTLPTTKIKIVDENTFSYDGTKFSVEVLESLVNPNNIPSPWMRITKKDPDGMLTVENKAWQEDFCPHHDLGMEGSDCICPPDHPNRK